MKNFLFNQFRKNEARLHQLSYLFWECTHRCNMNCLHCGSDCSADSKVKDLPECGRKLREHGFPWGMVTNGCGYTPEIHGKLLAAGMGSITLSLDGLEAAHNRLQ